MYAYMCEDAHKGQKKVLDPPELEFETIVSCPV